MTTPLPAHGDPDWDVALNAAVTEIKATADSAETPAGSQAKADAVNATLTAHTGNVSNPHSTTKAQVGLGSVPNVDATARASHTGTQSADTLTDGTTNKAFLATERTKLTGVATGATANSTDATLLARANHTGTQAAGTITGLAAVATSGAKADVGLGNVDNTSDVNKPVSTATTAAMNARSGLPSYAPTTSPNAWEPIRGIYDYKSSNSRILDQGLSNAMFPVTVFNGAVTGGGMTEQVVIGDSVSAGAVSSVGVTLFDRLHSWPIAMRDQLATWGIPSNGTGWVRVTDGPTALDSRWVATGTWANGSSYASTVQVGATGVFSPDRGGTYFDLGYYDSTGGTFTITIDGTLVKTVTASGSAGWKTVRIANQNIIANFSTITVALTVVGTSGMRLNGGCVFTPNAGLIVHNVSQSGATASGTGATAWADIASFNSLGQVYQNTGGRKRSVTDATSTTGSSTLGSATAVFTTEDLGKAVDQTNLGAGGLMFPPGSYIGAFISATQVTMYAGAGASAAPVLALSTQTAQSINIGRDPSCIHIVLGGNDMAALAASDATITAALTTIRNRWPNSDCILHIQHEFNPATVSGAREATYQAAMFVLADTLGVGLYDWRDRVGPYATASANGVMGDNSAHLTAQTYADLGAAIAAVFGGGSGKPQSNGDPVFDNDVVNKQYIDRRKAKTATGSATTTVETVVLSLPIQAGKLTVADQIRYTLWAIPTVATATTVRVRIGSTGTISDAAVCIMSVTASGASAAPRYCEGAVTITTTGASAAFLGGGSETVGAVAQSGVATTTTGTFNSGVKNYVTVTVQNGTSTTTAVRGSVEWI
jgi:hypothetical protein